MRFFRAALMDDDEYAAVAVVDAADDMAMLKK